MAAVLLGMLIAVSFGSGDFVGGRASSRSSTVAVLFVSQACSALGALALVFFVSAHVAPHDLGYGALAGCVNVIGLGLLYHGLANYPAGVVAPIAALVGSLVPVGWGLAHGERPSTMVLCGVLLAIAAGALIAYEGDASLRTGLARGAPLAIASGIGLGSSLVLYSETSSGSGQYPVLAARTSAFVLAALALLWMRRAGPVPLSGGSARTLAIAAGAFDIVATALIVVAVRRELLSVVAPVASLAPGFTVILAWQITRERLSTLQRIGLAMALAGLVLVAVG